MAGLKVHRTVSSRPNWTGMSWRIWLRPFESNIGGGGGAIYDLLGLLSGVRPQAVTDALVLMQTGRALAARRVRSQRGPARRQGLFGSGRRAPFPVMQRL
jgi:hypothetical protein